MIDSEERRNRGRWYVEEAMGGAGVVLEEDAGCGGGPGEVAHFELIEDAEAVVAWWNSLLGQAGEVQIIGRVSGDDAKKLTPLDQMMVRRVPGGVEVWGTDIGMNVRNERPIDLALIRRPRVGRSGENDLLEALKNLENAVEDPMAVPRTDDEHEWRKVVMEARAAIARAEEE